ncbi:MAG: hypothetical protein Q8Q09_13365 [Deltaproteobacteria bacterium]|nr:hypothetical protein [Deltaproteobacteria bacterium]
MFAVMFHKSALLVFPLMGLAIFVGIFAAAFIRTVRRSAKSFDAIAAMPLVDAPRVQPSQDSQGVSS